MAHYNRKEWGGRPPEARYKLDPLKVVGVALHWPGILDPLTNVDQVCAALRSWQGYHMDVKGWSDIAYQVAVDQAGNTYGLRGLRYRSGANGDQTTNVMYGAFLLVVAIGEQPTGTMVKAVRSRVDQHRNLFPKSQRIVGHRDIRPEPTACPGELVDDMIDAGRFGDPKRRTS